MTTPTTPAADAVREAFEAWITSALNYGFDLAKDAEGDYTHGATETAWFTWEAATARESALVAERDALRAEVAKLMRVAISYSDIISNHCIAMQSAVIDAAISGPGAGMTWINNTLIGPGLYPDIDAARELGGAQAWFDAKTAEEEARKAALAAPAVEGE